MAEEFPKTTFAFGTSADVGPKNVFTYMPQSEETGYLNGLIAGMVTKSNIVGLVGPVDGGDAARYDRGFVLGREGREPEGRGEGRPHRQLRRLRQGRRARPDPDQGGRGRPHRFLPAGARRAARRGRVQGQPIWWVGQDVAQLHIPESSRVIAAASYDYGAVIEALMERRAAGVLGGENLPLNFANGGFVYEFNAVGRAGPHARRSARTSRPPRRSSLPASSRWTGRASSSDPMPPAGPA